MRDFVGTFLILLIFVLIRHTADGASSHRFHFCKHGSELEAAVLSISNLSPHEAIFQICDEARFLRLRGGENAEESAPSLEQSGRVLETNPYLAEDWNKTAEELLVLLDACLGVPEDEEEAAMAASQVQSIVSRRPIGGEDTLVSARKLENIRRIKEAEKLYQQAVTEACKLPHSSRRLEAIIAYGGFLFEAIYPSSHKAWCDHLNEQVLHRPELTSEVSAALCTVAVTCQAVNHRVDPWTEEAPPGPWMDGAVLFKRFTTQPALQDTKI